METCRLRVGQLQLNFVVLHDKEERMGGAGASASIVVTGPVMGGRRKRVNEDGGMPALAKRTDWREARGRGKGAGGRGGGRDKV